MNISGGSRYSRPHYQTGPGNARPSLQSGTPGLRKPVASGGSTRPNSGGGAVISGPIGSNQQPKTPSNGGGTTSFFTAFLNWLSA